MEIFATIKGPMDDQFNKIETPPLDSVYKLTRVEDHLMWCFHCTKDSPKAKEIYVSAKINKFIPYTKTFTGEIWIEQYKCFIHSTISGLKFEPQDLEGTGLSLEEL